MTLRGRALHGGVTSEYYNADGTAGWQMTCACGVVFRRVRHRAAVAAWKAHLETIPDE